MKALLTGALAGAFAAQLSACSIYPTIDESHGKDTYEIVRDIRCEARDAIASELLGIAVDAFGNTPVYRGWTGLQLAQAVKRNDIKYAEIYLPDLDRHLWANWEYYFNSTMSYDFTLQVEEQNNQDVTLGFNAKRFGDTSKLPLALDNDHRRNVERNFFIFDTWRDLFTSPKLFKYCQSVPQEPNFQYPLAGKLKVAELIQQFVDLNQSGNLSNKDETKAATTSAPTISDTLTFTTKVAANFDPMAIVGQAVSRYTLTNISGSVDNYRQDLHKVIITVSLPPDKGGFAVTKSLTGSQNAATLAAQEATRQRDNSAKNAIIQLGSGLPQFLQ